MTAGRWPALAEIARTGSEAVEASRRRIDALDDELGTVLWRSGAAAEGVPVLVKDNIAVAGLPLTCGSKILEAYVAPYDATVVERLRAAGYAVVGKSNMDEFAMGSSTEMSAYRPCRNPWDTTRVPGGSSGGSAAAVAAGLVPVALGSDTGGSGRQPAAFCGVIGFKPSYGRVSRYGLVAYGSSLDQIGVLATRVADAREVIGVIAGPDGRDETLVSGEEGSGKRPTRVGVVVEYGDHPAVEPAIRSAVARAVEACRAKGFEVVEVSLPCLDETVIPAYYLTATAEAGSNLARYDGVRYGSRGAAEAETQDELVRGTRALFGAEVKLRILLGTFVLRAGHYDQYYGRAQAARRRIAAGLAGAFEGVDVLLTPTAPTRAFGVGELVDDPVAMKLADLFTVTANLAGLPALSLPVGVDGGLPTAVQVMGPRFGDEAVLEVAEALESELAFPYEQCPAMGRGPAVGGAA